MAGAKTLPQSYFVAPDIFQSERERIFAREWVCVGHQSRLEKPGSYFVQEVAGESLVIVRDKAGEIHGFFNVCRHRGTRICEEAEGSCSVLQCPYHAWTYGLDGRLLGAPSMEAVPGFTPADFSLHRVSLDIWEGLIFVSLADAPLPLAEFFAPLCGKVFALESADPAFRPADHLRCGGELEVDLRELLRVLPLFARPSGAEPVVAFRFRGE